MTACTPGSAPGPTLGNEYGKPLPLLLHMDYGVNAGDVLNGVTETVSVPYMNAMRGRRDAVLYY